VDVEQPQAGRVPVGISFHVAGSDLEGRECDDDTSPQSSNPLRRIRSSKNIESLWASDIQRGFRQQGQKMTPAHRQQRSTIRHRTTPRRNSSAQHCKQQEIIGFNIALLSTQHRRRTPFIFVRFLIHHPWVEAGKGSEAVYMRVREMTGQELSTMQRIFIIRARCATASDTLPTVWSSPMAPLRNALRDGTNTIESEIAHDTVMRLPRRRRTCVCPFACTSSSRARCRSRRLGPWRCLAS